MFEVLGALIIISVQQPLLALVSFAITPLLSRLLRSVVVKSSAIIYKRQQVRISSGRPGSCARADGWRTTCGSWAGPAWMRSFFALCSGGEPWPALLATADQAIHCNAWDVCMYVPF